MAEKIAGTDLRTHYLVSPSEAVDVLEFQLKCQLVPILRGSPGIGKSDIYRQIAKKHNLLLIDIRLAQCDPTDLNVA